MTFPDSIIIEGARQHNLKNISLCLPRNRLVVITGLSGSGKSTLAFDTLYAEGQRRYVESLSTYARQFLQQLEKPEVDLIEGLSPAIAIEQKTTGYNLRSTVGTVTEIYDFIRLLYARCGTAFCFQCGLPIVALSIDEMVEAVLQQPAGSRLIILSPVEKDPRSGYGGVFKRLRKEGFARVRVDGKICELEAVETSKQKSPKKVDVVIDRLILSPAIRNRLTDSMELAISRSKGQVDVLVMGKTGEKDTDSFRFSETATCPHCGISYPELTPASFSFNSPHGACPQCNGLGSVKEFSPDQIVPNPELSLREGAVAIWPPPHRTALNDFLEDLTAFYKTDIYTTYKDLPESFKTVLMHGSGDQEIPFSHKGPSGKMLAPFEGILSQLRCKYSIARSAAEKNNLATYMADLPCPECHGARLRLESRHVKVNHTSIDGLVSRSISDLLIFFQTFQPEGNRRIIAGKIVREILSRLTFLADVGLSYLTLSRPAHTLSGGEAQRIRLATQIGAKLTGVLYVLDEPSIGLHQRDNHRLLKALIRMRDMGNSVVVVEHDEETILAADHVVDMGPGAGINGGHVIFEGPVADLLSDERSLTGGYLSGRLRIPVPETRRSLNKGEIRIIGATCNNLKHMDAAFPLGTLVCVTGVSGSGKSTLVIDTLYRTALGRLRSLALSSGRVDAITGLEKISAVIEIDQSPIGKTPRSNPATYTGLFSPIRTLFSQTPEARMRGYTPSRFSFNRHGGRCEACEGDGIIRIEMHFLPDVYVPCDVCRGNRYNRETLEIRYKGKNIAEVLNLTIDQCLDMFRNVEPIREKLQMLSSVGLGYIPIGQPATTLSGGEAQRIRLARELSRRQQGNTLYILDEPTTGLHPDDIRKLLDVLHRLVDAGNTVVVIEHNLDVIKTADYIIDLGPEGGDGGGSVVACGPPEAICKAEASHTGQYLKKILEK
ncbi:excinuclease ABC subunit UvrA [Desulfosarcina sp. OttesenSCG-928-A07]|nr:excinuclease ABC subunit UvrA [Desulfosarcina sp. OttesenSCG-928-A07]